MEGKMKESHLQKFSLMADCVHAHSSTREHLSLHMGFAAEIPGLKDTDESSGCALQCH